MKVDKFKHRKDFYSEDGDKLSVYYSNRGEPYREGVEVSFQCEGEGGGPYVFLEDREARELRDFLIQRYPLK